MGVPQPCRPCSQDVQSPGTAAFSSQSRRPAQGSTPEKAPPAPTAHPPSFVNHGALYQADWPALPRPAAASACTCHTLGMRARAQVRRTQRGAAAPARDSLPHTLLLTCLNSLQLLSLEDTLVRLGLTQLQSSPQRQQLAVRGVWGRPHPCLPASEPRAAVAGPTGKPVCQVEGFPGPARHHRCPCGARRSAQTRGPCLPHLNSRKARRARGACPPGPRDVWLHRWDRRVHRLTATGFQDRPPWRAGPRLGPRVCGKEFV